MKAVLLTSSVLILILIALRYLLRGRISLRLQYALWLLVAVRLLVPVEVGKSQWSVLAIWQRMPFGSVAQAVENMGSRPVRAYSDAYAEVVEQYEAQGVDVSQLQGEALWAVDYEARALQKQGSTLAETAKIWGKYVYGTGCGAIAVWFLGANVLFRRRLRRSALPAENVACPLPVYVSAAIPSPCLSGLLRPAVYLTPGCLASEERLRHVLAHELTHYRHKDGWWALVRCVCLCLYWFDPLVWWAATLSRRDCELACDEGALACLGEGERIPYGRTLVDMVAMQRRVGLWQTSTTMTGGKRSLRERVRLIAKKPRMLAVTALGLCLVLAVTVGCTFTDAASPTLTGALLELPETLTGEVTAQKAEEATAIYRLSGTDGARLLVVQHLDEAAFEAVFIDDPDHSGWECFAKDETWYYALYTPADMGLSAEERARKEAVSAALRDFVKETVLQWEGVTAFDGAQYCNELYYHSGCNHMDVYYYPDFTRSGSRAVTWILQLAQPVIQGEGGVWGVELVQYEDGSHRPVRPDTGGVSSDAYYRQLQTMADGGKADWAKQPLEVCQRFVEEACGHTGVTAECFNLGPEYSVTFGADLADEPNYYEQGLSEEAIAAQKILRAIDSDETIVLSMTAVDGRGGGRYEVPVNISNVDGFWEAFSLIYGWKRTDRRFNPSPEPDWSVSVASPDGSASMTVWCGSNLVRLVQNEQVFWYEVETLYDGLDAAAYARMLYDEAEFYYLQESIVIPDRGQSYQEIAQAYVEAYEGIKTRLRPDSETACTYVRCEAEIEEEAPDSWYPASLAGMERFYFSYTCIFVPANERARNVLMAGNTVVYEGGDAPNGAYIYALMGPMYRTEEGWRCAGLGTGP